MSLEVGTRAGIYARVSTHDQQTLPMQIAAMRDYAERRGWNVALMVEDIGSGASNRPKREELVKAALRRQIDVILVWRLDRWGRSTRATCYSQSTEREDSGTGGPRIE